MRLGLFVVVPCSTVPISSSGFEQCGLNLMQFCLVRTQGPVEASVGDPKLSDPVVVAELSRQMLQVFLDSPRERILTTENGRNKAYSRYLKLSVTLLSLCQL
jgi:hypothetical protein